MILVFGGACQGKLSWAVETFGLKQEELVDCAGGFPKEQAPCLYHLEKISLDCAQKGLDTVQWLREREEIWKDAVLLCRDIGCGVVPVDPLERAWREENGKMLRFLGGRADRVSRIFCGLEARLK